jgi:uncharacterized membrane protein YgcG
MLRLKAHVASGCFKCFRGTLQVFHMDVAKRDQDVVYVAMVVHVCCKSLFLMFHLFSRRMLQVCLSRCCICFTHLLQVFYLDIAYILQLFFKCFQVFFQVFQTYVANASAVLDICCKSISSDVARDPPATAACCSYWGTAEKAQMSGGGSGGGASSPRMGSSGAGSGGTAPKWARETECRRERPDVRVLALQFFSSHVAIVPHSLACPVALL